MSHLDHYLRLHLTGAAGGIELFGRGEQFDDDARTELLGIRDELVDERRRLLRLASDLGIRPAPLSAVGAKIGERIERLKPNGHPLRRTPLADLLDLETMRVALSGKIAGFEALLAVSARVQGLPAGELRDLLEQALRQLEQVSRLHDDAARRALVA